MSLTLGELKGYLLQHHAQDIDVLKRFNTVAQQLNKQSGAILSPSIHRYVLEGGSGSDSGGETDDDHNSVLSSDLEGEGYDDHPSVFGSDSEGEDDDQLILDSDDIDKNVDFEDRDNNLDSDDDEEESQQEDKFKEMLKVNLDRLKLDVCKRHLTLKYLVDKLSLLMKENRKELQSKLKLKKTSDEEYEAVNKENVKYREGKGGSWLFYPDPSDDQNFYYLKKTTPTPTPTLYVKKSTFEKLAKRFFEKHKAKKDAPKKPIKGYLKLPLKFYSLLTESDNDIKEFTSNARPKMEIDNKFKQNRMQDDEIIELFKK